MNKETQKTAIWARDILTIMSGTTFSEKGQYERKLRELLETYLDAAFKEGFSSGLNTKNAK